MNVPPSHVLIVDDNLENQRVIAGHLVENGHSPLFAANGFDALEVVRDERPDLVLLDIMMPGIDGWETCRRMREMHAAVELPIIMLSAKTGLNDIVRSFDMGANDYVSKPIIGRELLARVNKELLVRHSVMERDQLNASLRQMNENQQTFFSVLAHDLRNRLGGCISIVDVLAHDAQTNPRYLDVCQHARGELRGTHVFLDNLLSWGMRQMQQADLQWTRFTFGDLLAKLRLFVAMQLEQRDLKLINEVPEDLAIWGDFDLVQTIVRNFLDNAQKFSRPGGRIWIEGDVADGQLRVSVRDEGDGMTHEQLEKVRNAQSVMPQDTQERASSGFGLRLSKQFAERMGGEIQVESIQGKGSTFVLCLPQADEDTPQV